MEAYTPHNLSCESWISLPDEVKQYITHMGESPVPSPNSVDAFAPRSRGPPTTLPEPPRVVQPNVRELLGMDEDLVDEEDRDEEDRDEEDRDEADEQSPLPRTLSSPPQSMTTPQPHTHGQKVKTWAVVEDIPLLPPTSHLPLMSQIQIPTQAQSFSTMTKVSSGGQPQSADTASLDSSRAETPIDDPIPSTVPPPEAARRTAEFRALPLLSSDLPRTKISVPRSFVRPNDRGKEVLYFTIVVDPGNGKDKWRVEKMYSNVLALDHRVRNSVGKSAGKRIAYLPEGKLWKDRAPAKVDQRKTVLEHYLQTLINLPVKRNDEVIAFLTSDILHEAKQPMMMAGHWEGYLTKRGKNFGGWKTRYFVLQGPVLEYYDCRGGPHLGSISVKGASIDRQQESEHTAPTDEEKGYQHAFLIVEAKMGPKAGLRCLPDTLPGPTAKTHLTMALETRDTKMEQPFPNHVRARALTIHRLIIQGTAHPEITSRS
ncbi:hypothetical protein BD779DRAFT_540718 [Infundibulicybe gibba]|nr:hypothetical protein BD779DRAFT_540718 [Infundibulicybe gibba]